jgi:hypothetical protein
MKHWRRWAFVAVALWIAAVTVWALDPASVNVRTELNADGTEQTATVQCDSPLSGNTSPTSALPVVGPGESIGDAPCDNAVSSGRVVYVIDILAGAGVLIFLVMSRGHLDERPEPDLSKTTTALT